MVRFRGRRGVQRSTGGFRTVAEGYGQALRSFFLDEEIVECPHEENFEEMYEVLGDRDKQKEIRLVNPRALHCFDLEASPRACDGCRFNPYKNIDRKKLKVSEKWKPFILNALKVFDDVTMFGVGMDELTPCEYASVRITRHVLEVKKDERLIGGIARILSGIFGGRGNA